MHIHTDTHTRTQTHTHTYVYIRMYVYVFMHECSRMCIHIHLCIYVCTYVSLCVYMCACIITHARTRTPMHTRAHTYTRAYVCECGCMIQWYSYKLYMLECRERPTLRAHNRWREPLFEQQLREEYRPPTLDPRPRCRAPTLSKSCAEREWARERIINNAVQFLQSALSAVQ